MKLIILLLTCITLHSETLEEVQKRIDSWWEINGKEFKSRQDEYKKGHTNYFQGLRTHSKLPDQMEAKADDSIPDNLDVKPTKQAETWVDFAPEVIFNPLPCAIIIDNYSGPDGDGWVVRYELKFEKTVYLKTINYGPEEYRNQDWILANDTEETLDTNVEAIEAK